MTKTPIGKLERVDLREVWKHEAHNFTQWLENNIGVLNDALDLNLVNVDREQAAGSFSIDLVAEDEGGGTVIIENQLEKSNHDHLGKLITYLTAMSAKAAIWIVSDPRPEHVAAITWLNESSSAAFYMVKVEAVRIGDSPPAPLFTLIVGPSEETQSVGQAKKEIAERYGIRKRWWSTLIERSGKVNKLHAHITPGEYAWIGASSGLRGLNLNYVVTQDWRGAELYIDRGKDSEDENKFIFDQLAAHKSEIEDAFGGELSWERLDGKRACRIRIGLSDGGYRTAEEKWPALQDEIIKAMDRLEKSLRPYLSQLKLKG
ncbi:MAG: DUF4268 domain-containing protein [Candidatus Methylacidiphilales bacterium]|nr:DUF4268 domain-containing protein [Candidatus Methylacidiphilales bacterium]